MSKIILYEKKGSLNILEHFYLYNKLGNFDGKLSKGKYGYFKYEKNERIEDKDVKKYYADKTKTISITHSKVEVTEENFKVSIKFKYDTRVRQKGGHYFKVRRDIYFVTYNTKTKNFYYGRIVRKNKKLISKKIRCNQFKTPFLTELKLSVRRTFNHFISKYGDWKDIISSRTEYGSYGDEMAYNALEQFAYAIFNKNLILFDYKSNHLENQLYKLYLKDNNISFPDTVAQYSVIQIPKAKMLKEGNIVNCFMNSNNISGRHARVILNQCEDIDFHTLNEVYHNFGVDYFSRIRKNFFSRSTDGMYNAWFNMIDVKVNCRLYDLNKTDKKRMVNLINESTEIDWGLIKNHLYMINELKKFGEDFKMRFINRHDFNHEHYQVTELLEKYKEGKVTRVYNEEFVREVEEPIYGLSVDYYPVILTNSVQYNEESKTQSNCVRTYLEYANCFIISLREGSWYGNVRATIEYKITKNSLNRVQTRGRFNTNLSEIWDIPLEILDNRIDMLFKKGKFDLPKLLKEFSNGRIIHRYSLFDDSTEIKNIHPVWNEKLDTGYISNIDNEIIIEDLENFNLPF